MLPSWTCIREKIFATCMYLRFPICMWINLHISPPTRLSPKSSINATRTQTEAWLPLLAKIFVFNFFQGAEED